MKMKYFIKKVYTGEDCISVFIKEIRLLSYKINAILANKKPINQLSNEEEINYSNANQCYLCKNPFTKRNYKVKDHCKLSGVYRGPAHNECNLSMKLSKMIPLFFHNLKNYDSHFIIENLKSSSFEKVKIIPQTIEKFISLSLDTIQLLDSYQFLTDSLNNLVDNLRQSKNPFIITKSIFLKN